MDKIELNGEIYIKKSTINKIDDNEILNLLQESSIDPYEIAVILKDKLANKIDGEWINKEDVDSNEINVRNLLLYIALNNYC